VSKYEAIYNKENYDGVPGIYQLGIELSKDDWDGKTVKAHKVGGWYILLDNRGLLPFDEHCIFGVESDPIKVDRRLYERLRREALRLRLKEGGRILDETREGTYVPKGAKSFRR